jgi:hypothetical protein
MEVLHHIVRELAGRNEVVLEYCSTERMVAYCLTEVVGMSKFFQCRECMGMVDVRS